MKPSRLGGRGGWSLGVAWAGVVAGGAQAAWAAETSTAAAAELQGLVQLLDGDEAVSARLFDPIDRGLAALLRGEPETALARLPSSPEWAVYRAMAWVRRGAGAARARAEVESGARGGDPAASFWAALFRARVGETERADALLRRACEGSDPLAERFAPDPAHRLLVRIWERAGRVSPADAEAVFEAWWRSGRSRAPEGVMPPERFNLRRALAFRHPDRFDQARARLKRDPGDRLARFALARAALDQGDLTKAAAYLEGGTDPPRMLRARLALAEGRTADALADLEAVAPKARTPSGLALWARALKQLRRHDAAGTVIGRLLERQPLDVDPFALRAELLRSRRRDPKLAVLRSRAWRREMDRVAAQVAARQAVLQTVERSRDTLTFGAQREREVRFGLPLDLALAARGAPAEARAARARILRACADDVVRLLRHEGTWDQVTLRASPYGRVVTLTRRLPAADPARCGGIARDLGLRPVRP